MTVLNYPNPKDIPVNVQNTMLKYGYTYIIQEAMRLLHNRIGTWYREGLTLAQYNNLPQFVKDMVAYQPKLNEKQWEYFKSQWWDGRQQTVLNDLLELRADVKGYITQYVDSIRLEDIPDGS